MADTISREQRSRLMARIRSKDTTPELQMRSVLHRAGYRFRIHVGTLPGRPGSVMRRHRAVVFVHGCFWHRHRGCRIATMPKSRVGFWTRKFRANVARDRRHRKELEALGWKVIVVWECELRKSAGGVLRRVEAELGTNHSPRGG